MKRNSIIFVSITVIISTLTFLLGREIGWKEAFVDLLDSKECRMSRKEYKDQIN